MCGVQREREGSTQETPPLDSSPPSPLRKGLICTTVVFFLGRFTFADASLHMFIISVVTRSTSFMLGSRSLAICALDTMSNARSGVNKPMRTPGEKKKNQRKNQKGEGARGGGGMRVRKTVFFLCRITSNIMSRGYWVDGWGGRGQPESSQNTTIHIEMH